MKLIAAAVAMLAAAPASAAPAYLSCVINGDKGPMTANVTADEANQQVTLELPSTGHVVRVPAVFSSTTVAFNDPLPFGRITYAVNRVDLTLTRSVFGNSLLGTDNGTCKVDTASKRAF